MRFTQNTIKRATRTFVQAAVAYIAVYLANYGTDELSAHLRLFLWAFLCRL